MLLTFILCVQKSIFIIFISTNDDDGFGQWPIKQVYFIKRIKNEDFISNTIYTLVRGAYKEGSIW